MLPWKQIPAKQYQLFVVAWMLLAALLPLYAPWLNRNFAAIQPGHDHLYLGKSTQFHPHNLAQRDQSGQSGSHVTNLPNLEAGGGTAVPILISLWLLAPLVSTPRFSLFKEHHLGIDLIILLPPGKPPRLATSHSIPHIATIGTCPRPDMAQTLP